MENYMEYNDICPHLNENWVRFCNLTPKEQEHEYERIRTGHEVCLKGSERRLVYYRLLNVLEYLFCKFFFVHCSIHTEFPPVYCVFTGMHPCPKGSFLVC